MKKFIITIVCLFAIPVFYCSAHEVVPSTRDGAEDVSVMEKSDSESSHEIIDPYLESFFQVVDDLEEMESQDLAELTGQIGVVIDMSVQITGGYIAWGDKDGFPSPELSDPGYITLSGMTLDDGQDPAGAMDIIGLTLDAGTDNGRSFVAIGMPDLEGRVAFVDIKLGPEANEGPSLGSLEIGDLSVASSTIKILPRD